MSGSQNSYQPSHTVLQASVTNVGQLFKNIAKQHDTDIAISEHNQQITYGELNNRVNQLANGLIAQKDLGEDFQPLIKAHYSSLLKYDRTYQTLISISVT